MKRAAGIRARTAARLERLAERLGDPRFAHAAGILIGKRAGRRAIDDGEALAYAETLIAAGAVRSRRQACEIAATIYCQDNQVDSMRDRLARKLRHK